MKLKSDLELHERAAAGKAILWSALAGLGQLGLAATGPAGEPAPFLVGLGGAFILPGVALLHARNASFRASGAVLATVSAGACVSVGIASAAVPEVRPAWLVLLGMWWWTLGKMSVETGTLPRSFGRLTALAGAGAFAASLVVHPASPAPAWLGLGTAGAATVYRLAQAALGAWLLGLATAIARIRLSP